MSKGHGIIQRHVLRELAEAAANTHSRDWVAVVEMGWSSRAKKQAVRRAMKRLAEEGYVELFYRPLRDVEYGGRVRTHLCGRITDKGLHALARAYAELGERVTVR
jgi:predicted ArsR family transcriptional regulator